MQFYISYKARSSQGRWEGFVTKEKLVRAWTEAGAIKKFKRNLPSDFVSIKKVIRL